MRLIDADRLLTDRMKSKYYHLPNGDIAIPLIDIEHAPTIEPERKTGKWIDRWAQNGEQVREVRECSECGAFYLRYYDTADGFDCVPPRYCPNCGAKMGEGERDA